MPRQQTIGITSTDPHHNRPSPALLWARYASNRLVADEGEAGDAGGRANRGCARAVTDLLGRQAQVASTRCRRRWSTSSPASCGRWVSTGKRLNATDGRGGARFRRDRLVRRCLNRVKQRRSKVSAQAAAIPGTGLRGLYYFAPSKADTGEPSRLLAYS